MRTLLNLTIVIGLVLLYPLSAYSQGVKSERLPHPRPTVICDTHKNIVEKLEKQHKERQFSIGINRVGNLIEVFVAKDGKWTIIATNAKKRACVVDHGKDWHSVPLKRLLI